MENNALDITQYKYTPKEELFCLEFLVDMNATRAYLRAGYKAKNENTANTSAHRMLAKPKIRAKITQLMQERAERVEINADWVLREAKDVYDMAKGVLPHKVSYRTKDKVETLEITKTNLREATKALMLIGRHINVKAFDKEIDLGDGVVFTCVLPKELEN